MIENKKKSKFKNMLKRTIIYIFSAISFLNLISLPSIYAADKPAVWLKVTASGVPGSAPR